MTGFIKLDLLLNLKQLPEQKAPEPSTLTMKRDSDLYQTLTAQEVSKKLGNAKEKFDEIEFSHSIEDQLTQTVKDDQLKSETWSKAFKTAAYYYDNPTSADRYEMMNNLSFNYANLLNSGNNPDEIPDLRSNRHLLKWMCTKYNEYLTANESTKSLQCNLKMLMKTYGPQTDLVKKSIGGSEFFI